MVGRFFDGADHRERKHDGASSMPAELYDDAELGAVDEPELVAGVHPRDKLRWRQWT